MNYLGIEKTKTDKTVKELNQLLACHHVYYQNLRNFHWNVQGENFFALHAQFEALYQDARTQIDAIAERILTLRHRPMSNMSDYLDASMVDEAGNVKDDRKMVSITLDNHKRIIECMRNVLDAAENAGDEGTNDLISGFLGDIEKKSWMLDAWLSHHREPVAA
ncbi:MAG: DNA starvation/stationary phase protection protein [Bacteroidetes bacterium]|nr:DNA starvation/stationary phase protection protein [Bacteroidota bacterium]